MEQQYEEDIGPMYDEAVWHFETWKYRRSEREFHKMVGANSMVGAGAPTKDTYFHTLLQGKQVKVHPPHAAPRNTANRVWA
jgi:hypothetical protein